jgi:hypothetical protein
MKPWDLTAHRLEALASKREAWMLLAKHLEIPEADFVQWALRQAAKEYRAKRATTTVTEVRP